MQPAPSLLLKVLSDASLCCVSNDLTQCGKLCIAFLFIGKPHSVNCVSPQLVTAQLRGQLLKVRGFGILGQTVHTNHSVNTVVADHLVEQSLFQVLDASMLVAHHNDGAVIWQHNTFECVAFFVPMLNQPRQERRVHTFQCWDVGQLYAFGQRREGLYYQLLCFCCVNWRSRFFGCAERKPCVVIVFRRNAFGIVSRKCASLCNCLLLRDFFFFGLCAASA